ncbi:VOC family protein [Kribbella sp. CA-245084]|uniref:VOC family protein n=1 Tax=Kribbella sp. CA-245084 TaxID=3239940 RepID=UPI003D8E4344
MDGTGIRLSSPTINCPDAATLGRFYAQITGGKLVYTDPGWATMAGPGGRIDFQSDPAHVPPTWPDPTVPIQYHLDFYVEDLAGAAELVLAAGATQYEHQPNADHCLVFADPAGHPFCLSTWDMLEKQ